MTYYGFPKPKKPIKTQIYSHRILIWDYVRYISEPPITCHESTLCTLAHSTIMVTAKPSRLLLFTHSAELFACPHVNHPC